MLMIFISGCSNPEVKKSEVKKPDEPLNLVGNKAYASKTIDDFTIKISKVSIEKNNLKLKINVKNLNSKKRLFDALVFTVKNKEGKELKIAAEDNLSSTIKSNATMEGYVQFDATGSAPFDLYYNDLEKFNEKLWTIE